MAVYIWIKAFGEFNDTLRSAAGVVVIEKDELHSSIGAKKTLTGFGCLWIAIITIPPLRIVRATVTRPATLGGHQE
jgi:hypothetical protein